MKTICCLLLIFIWAVSSPAGATVVINEVLANEPGSSTSLEWVELFNPDDLAVDLKDWKFIEGNDTTVITNSILIGGKSYLVLARKLITTAGDSGSFEGFWGDASGVWGDSPVENFPALEAKMTLTNSDGTVTLIDPDGNLQSFTWNKDFGDKVSWEKINPQSGDSLNNWSACTLPSGSTPGKVNSVTPVENDLTIQEISALTSPIIPNTDFSLEIKIQNLGTATSQGNFLNIYDDSNFDQNWEESEKIVSPVDIPSIDVNQPYLLNVILNLPSGNYRLYAELGPDDKIYNNLNSLDLKVGGQLPDIVINEIMAAPDLTQNQTEWVELYNRSQNTVNLKNWLMGDKNKQILIIADELLIPPSNFLILTEDRNKFLATYPDINSSVIQVENWQTLNNSDDEVVLRDSLGFSVEQVTYGTLPPNGISWERIDYDKASSDSANWWRCVDSQGATPGKENSVHTTFSSNIQLKLSPNPFSPDGDGFDDELNIEYQIPLGSNLTLKIYDVKGRLVRSLLNDQPAVSGNTVWDGKNDAGKIVRTGIYILFVQITGEHKESKKAAISIVKK
ncbi:MAG TPA: lamin tail domain-containing protein [candidate division Zixibacteria bacterium]|nr:lamin tail domain-containing protein [candidate division Zixibacteria bacterium]